MYSLLIKKDLIARHYLIGGDWGAENEPHSHQYHIEVCLEGPELDKHGFLVDIVDIEQRLDRLAAYFADQMLNDLPEFAGLNPSVEHFARIFSDMMLQGISTGRLTAMETRIWETPSARAAFRHKFDPAGGAVAPDQS